MKRAFLTILLSIIANISVAQITDNYNIKFVKQSIGDNTIKVNCTFDIFFQGRDSVSMSFGGNLNEASISHFKINKNIIYRLDFNNKKLVIYRNGHDIERISMAYVFANISTAIIYKGSTSTEFWDIGYADPSAEFYYPLIVGNKISYSVSVKCSNRIDYLLSCPPCGYTYAPICIAFFTKDKYVRSDYESCSILQIVDQRASTERENELSDLSKKSIEYFEKIYSDAYASPTIGTEKKPNFFFHDGNGSENRFVCGIILASQTKFSSHPSLLPLAHEIGHRWIGEYSIFVTKEDCYPFLHESINEFMVWQFIKECYGQSVYDKTIMECKKDILEYYNTHEHKPLLSYTRNTAYSPIYQEGPLLLHELSQQFGTEKIVSAISEFYNKYKLQKNVSIDNFISVLTSYIGDEAGKKFLSEISN